MAALAGRAGPGLGWARDERNEWPLTRYHTVLLENDASKLEKEKYDVCVAQKTCNSSLYVYSSLVRYYDSDAGEY